MSILTVELICLLFAAWKAPAWVREIGLLVLVTDLIWQLKGMFNAAEVVQQVGDVPLTLVAGGLKVSFISLIYALLIYAGLYGIAHKLTLPPASDFNLYTASAETLRTLRALPDSLSEAIALAEADPFVRAHLPHSVLCAFGGR